MDYSKTIICCLIGVDGIPYMRIKMLHSDDLWCFRSFSGELSSIDPNNHIYLPMVTVATYL